MTIQWKKTLGVEGLYGGRRFTEGKDCTVGKDSRRGRTIWWEKTHGVEGLYSGKRYTERRAALYSGREYTGGKDVKRDTRRRQMEEQTVPWEKIYGQTVR